MSRPSAAFFLHGLRMFLVMPTEEYGSSALQVGSFEEQEKSSNKNARNRLRRAVPHSVTAQSAPSMRLGYTTTLNPKRLFRHPVVCLVKLLSGRRRWKRWERDGQPVNVRCHVPNIPILAQNL